MINILKTLSLKSLLGTDFGEDLFKEIVSNFSCEKNTDLEDFLRNTALDLELKDISRTYFVIDTESDSETLEILGYFNISLKSLGFEYISNSKKRKLSGYKDVNSGIGFLIGQLGKNDNRAIEVKGVDLIKLAFSEINTAHNIVGGRFVYLDCEKNEKLLNFYKNEGFTETGAPPNKKKLIQMFCRLPILQGPDEPDFPASDEISKERELVTN